MRTRLSFDEAQGLVLSDVLRLPGETIALDAALGRIVDVDMYARFALPGFANAAMDGYALSAADLERAAIQGLPVSGTILAGDTREYVLRDGSAFAIMTGAPMPLGADTVVIQEQARREGDQVWLPADARPGANVRPADDDCAEGARVAAAGETLTPARIAVLASAGFPEVDVVRRPRVAVLATGDELVPPERPLGHGQRYDSNGPLLRGLVTDAGADIVEVRCCGDCPEQLRRALQDFVAREVDLILTCGGVSAGAADHLPATIAAVGEIVFWKVRMKPGMPVLYGRIGTTRVLALPGNPVSVGVTFELLARPLLDRLLGRSSAATFPVRMAVGLRKNHARMEFLRVTLENDKEGRWLATPLEHQGSGALTSLASAQALVRLEEGQREYQPGDVVQASRLPGGNL